MRTTKAAGFWILGIGATFAVAAFFLWPRRDGRPAELAQAIGADLKQRAFTKSVPYFSESALQASKKSREELARIATALVSELPGWEYKELSMSQLEAEPSSGWNHANQQLVRFMIRGPNGEDLVLMTHLRQDSQSNWTFDPVDLALRLVSVVLEDKRKRAALLHATMLKHGIDEYCTTNARMPELHLRRYLDGQIPYEQISVGVPFL